MSPLGFAQGQRPESRGKIVGVHHRQERVTRAQPAGGRVGERPSARVSRRRRGQGRPLVQRIGSPRISGEDVDVAAAGAQLRHLAGERIGAVRATGSRHGDDDDEAMAERQLRARARQRAGIAIAAPRNRRHRRRQRRAAARRHGVDERHPGGAAPDDQGSAVGVERGDLARQLRPREVAGQRAAHDARARDSLAPTIEQAAEIVAGKELCAEERPRRRADQQVRPGEIGAAVAQPREQRRLPGQRRGSATTQHQRPGQPPGTSPSHRTAATTSPATNTLPKIRLLLAASHSGR